MCFLTKRLHNSDGRYFDTMLLKIIRRFENDQNGHKNSLNNKYWIFGAMNEGWVKREDEAGG